MRRIYLVCSLTAILLSACQPSIYPNLYDEPKRLPPIGTTLELHQNIFVAQGTSRSFIQFGQTRNATTIKHREPWCQFYLFEPPQALRSLRVIVADHFIVTDSYHSIDSAMFKATIVAARLITPNLMNSSELFDHDVSAQTLTTIFKLASKKQPQVVELQCAIFMDPYFENFVSVNQITKTLGNIASVHLK